MQIVLIFHILFAIALIALVLMQQGKGATTGAAFGSGASQTMFGSQGANSFMLKVTGIFACLFFLTSLTLTYLISHPSKTAQPTNLLDQAALISKQLNTQKADEDKLIKSLPGK